MTHHISCLRLGLLLAPLALGGCGLNDWANAHMPVIGQRCENWQCFTESGRQQSELNHQERVMQQSGAVPAANGRNIPAENTTLKTAPGGPGVASTPAAAPALAPAPASGPAPGSTFSMEPGMPEEPTYHYVPRTPTPKGTTPFDGAMPPPIE